VKITEIKASYPRYGYQLPEWRPELWQIVVRVETDAGVTGWGWGGGGRASVPIVNGHFREQLLGREVGSTQDISAVWDDLYHASIPYGRAGIAIMALSGVDIALWDLLARAEGVPVYQLIGPRKKESVTAYGTGTNWEDFLDQGYSAFKLTHRWRGDPSVYQRTAEKVGRIREAYGPNALLMLDCYLSWDAEVTREMARVLSPYNIYWFEDVLTPEERETQAVIRGEIAPILMAGGEHSFTDHGFAEVARTGALDIWQPDVAWCGGVTALLRIIALADRTGYRVCPHRGAEPWGLHVIVASTCMSFAEYNPGRRGARGERAWIGEPIPEEGQIAPSEEPGFGLEPNATML
jgi:L-rhamnonate dehydratase